MTSRELTHVATAVIAGNFPWALVRIGIDRSVTGLDEAFRFAGVAERMPKAEPLLIGQDPANVAKLSDVMVRCLPGEGSQAGATVMATSGIEIALWDLLGRAPAPAERRERLRREPLGLRRRQ